MPSHCVRFGVTCRSKRVERMRSRCEREQAQEERSVSGSCTKHTDSVWHKECGQTEVAGSVASEYKTRARKRVLDGSKK